MAPSTERSVNVGDFGSTLVTVRPISPRNKHRKCSGPQGRHGERSTTVSKSELGAVGDMDFRHVKYVQQMKRHKLHQFQTDCTTRRLQQCFGWLRRHQKVSARIEQPPTAFTYFGAGTKLQRALFAARVARGILDDEEAELDASQRKKYARHHRREQQRKTRQTPKKTERKAAVEEVPTAIEAYKSKLGTMRKAPAEEDAAMEAHKSNLAAIRTISGVVGGILWGLRAGGLFLSDSAAQYVTLGSTVAACYH